MPWRIFDLRRRLRRAISWTARLLLVVKRIDKVDARHRLDTAREIAAIERKAIVRSHYNTPGPADRGTQKWKLQTVVPTVLESIIIIVYPIIQNAKFSFCESNTGAYW